MRGTFSHLSGSLHGVLSVKLNVSFLLTQTTVYHLAKHSLCRVVVVQKLHTVFKHCRVVQPGQIPLLVPSSQRVRSFALQILLLWWCWWHWKYLACSLILWILQLQDRKKNVVTAVTKSFQHNCACGCRWNLTATINKVTVMLLICSENCSFLCSYVSSSFLLFYFITPQFCSSSWISELNDD